MDNHEDDAAPLPPRQHYPPAPPYGPPPASPPGKSPLLAALFGLMMPGLGHVYLGLYQRALVIFLVWLGIFSTLVNTKDGPELGILIPLMIFIALFNVFDAYRQATFAAWGEPEEIRAVTRSRGKNNLALGIGLVAVGVYGLLRRYFDVDLSFLLDHWYLVVIVVGGWLIWQAMAANKTAAD